ncbi:protein-disulfide reductase DsbD domain-containing protein [Rhizobium halophytocola]|uniref:DsbC/DsbD-like thiol-disulfide interchange protein n=1 Tax=Rhizobium halophytocola TaxID=735519 RepID=A0ABS4DX68_9HYPH|nr:protein-disulfide reductase DsbD domain-containing protein [Rhizobium halophytocola]MBP1850291.1 DsbC/DsbD-like thiol-disulfide interchange protein [Rhizobium halophytocola]
MSTAATAGESAWAETEGGRMRLILAGNDGNGIYEGALEIEPQPGWITYWREPGDSGIPPQITVSPDSPLTLQSIAYPTPKRIDNGPVTDLAYDRPVSLPLTFQTDGKVDAAGKPLDLQVFIGLCKNICIPFQADFKLAVPAGSEPQDAIRIRMARQTLPAAPSKDFSVADVRRSDDGKALLMDLALPGGSAEGLQLYVTGKPGMVYMTYNVEKTAGGLVSVRMPIAGLPLAGQPKAEAGTWRLLAIDGSRAMQTPLAFD